MSTLRYRDLIKMRDEELIEELQRLEGELLQERGVSASGGAPTNPGRISQIKKDIARIKTVQRERSRRDRGE
ncbi:MAG TPA: 50S ribosomal protein L29 [Candidatus Syntrophoarchaeum butanivorans]|uniref:Large ribosomal subunit protein uL29 n=1 Tax=Candidatus Syntropharchaeum butanivorans TaxID=1839936 RepID=A0A7C1B4T9_9EURY|nr:50S ribosomal protein L29 [Candidatus Syntrophoarchaeum butanivorans]HEC57242.1 50S ribosomal protein L29 [Candidatus Syntrophoarchaeum butanivorans]